MAKLTEKQRRFVQHYTGNATEAAKLAGYSEKSAHYQGCTLLKNPNVKKALDEKIAKSAEVQKDLHQELYEFWRMMMKDADGDNNRIKASELLAKAESMFIQKQEITHNFQGKSKEEVIQMAIKELESLGYKVIPPK